MKHLTIHNLGPIRSADMELKDVNVVIGEQSSGKSCLLKTACYCTWVEKRIEIEQSTDRFEHGDAFIQQLIRFHKMADFVTDETEIAYESDYMRFAYSQKQFSFEWKAARWEYLLPKVSYIPSERNLVAVIPNWFQVQFDAGNIQDFMADWEDARKSMAEGYDVLNLGVAYYYDPASKSDNVRMAEGKSMKFANSSSGLQSLIPLLVVLNHITSNSSPDNRDTSVARKLERDHLRKSVPTDEIYNRFTTTDHCEIFLEEPEQNLFPPTQGVLIQALMSLTEGQRKNRLFIATHSPYVLNDMLERTDYDFGLMFIQPTADGSVVRQASEQDIQEIYEYGVDAFFNIETLGHE